VAHWTGVTLDPDREITVTCGATEGLFDVLIALLQPGDEVVMFEPFYENHVAALQLVGATPHFVRLSPPDRSFSEWELRAAFNDRTRGLLINTPNNPTGKVFTREELNYLLDLCRTRNVPCITDEIYQHLVYEDAEHMSPLELTGSPEWSIVVSGLSKSYSVTGWRVGWVLASSRITGATRKVHNTVTAGAPTPFQAAAVAALRMPDSYYTELRNYYQRQRDRVMGTLTTLGFACYPPQGAFYLMTDFSALYAGTDSAFVEKLIREVGVAAVPCTAFYSAPIVSTSLLRFCFGKSESTIDAALARLERFRPAPAPPAIE